MAKIIEVNKDFVVFDPKSFSDAQLLQSFLYELEKLKGTTTKGKNFSTHLENMEIVFCELRRRNLIEKVKTLFICLN